MFAPSFWWIVLSEYDLEIMFGTGKENAASYILSREPRDVETSETDEGDLIFPTDLLLDIMSMKSSRLC